MNKQEYTDRSGIQNNLTTVTIFAINIWQTVAFSRVNVTYVGLVSSWLVTSAV